MIDRKNVIYNIERCISHVPDACRDCSKYGTWDAMVCMEELLSDAMELLKEQKLATDINVPNKWISVKDRLPDMGVKCVIYRDGKMSVARHIANNDWITQAFFTYPTHWMPLPEPPKEETDGHNSV